MSDQDLASIAEARALARRAKLAQATLAEFSQDQIDRIVEAMAMAVVPHAEALARLAVEETTFGVVSDKIQKNLFASQRVFEFIKPMKTVGVINRIDDRKIIEIAEPFGVVAAIIPSTNPTSTAIYKILIAIKARCAVVMTPHPSAARCITRTADLMNEAGISGMRFSISETAKWGDVSVGPKIIDASVKKRMKQALKEIQNGKFAKGWVAEYKGGYKKYNALLKKGETHNIEKVGARLRSLMPWMQKRSIKGSQASY